jgi:hypothetical protein
MLIHVNRIATFRDRHVINKHMPSKMSTKCQCPPIEEYGGCSELTDYCDACLLCVANMSSSDWRHYPKVARKLLRSKTLTLTDEDIKWLQFRSKN